MLKEAKYEKMRKDILARIISGQFPNKRLPSIKHLADAYEVSLMTANKAVKLLEEAGIVQCRPGNVGTVIDEKKAALICSEMSPRHIWTDINLFVEKRVKLRYLCSDYTSENNHVWDEIIELFCAKYPWVDFEILSSENVTNDLIENREHDVLQIFGRDVERYNYQNRLMDISKLIDNSVDQDDFFPCSLTRCNVDGKFFALPIIMNTPVLFYNKKYFGEKTDKLNQDWSVFLSSVKDLVAKESYAAINMGISSMLHYFVGDMHNLINPGVNKAALRELIKIIKYVTITAPNDLAIQPENIIKNFLHEDIYLFCAYSSYIGHISEKSKFDWGILPMPEASGGIPVVETTVNGINPASKHKKEACLFVKFMCSQEAQDILARKRKFMPINNASFEEVYTSQDPLAAKTIKNIIKKAMPSSVSSQNLYTIYSCINPILEDYYSTYCQSEDTVEKILKSIREMLLLEYLD